MKKNKIIKKFAKLSVYTLLVALGTGCTDKFEEYNTNPFGPKPDQMLGDNAITGSLIKSMIPALVQGQQNNSQMLDQMIGSEYGGEITCIAQWGNGGNYYTYNPRVGWYGNMFDTTMPQIYTGYFQIRDLSDGKGLAYQWAQILRVAASLKISDCYGPIPYSQITGTAFTVEYDNMEDLYKHMFDDLDEAISAFKVAVLGNEDMSSLSEYDLVFNGDFNKWVKFANSLKLRMAMRISSVSPALAKEKAENADLSKSTFLANMSHEIRTPLNAITGFAEILASANTEEEKAQYQEIIKMNADLLLQLVNDILDMSKIEAGTLEFVYTKVDINLLLSDLRQLFQMKVNDAGGNIQIIAEPSLPSCSIETDRNRVAQVLSNFTTNAIKFTQEGTISIGYEARDTELYFYVTDTGAGIPADKLPEVFGRFVKLNKDKKGTGLGFSISKTIVNKLEGQIGADSVEGKGSTFWFTIPYRTCGRPE